MAVRLLLFVLGILTMGPLLYAGFTNQGQYAIYAIPFAILLSIAFVFKPQLEWAYYKRNPQDLDPELGKRVSSLLPSYYQNLSDDVKRSFRERIFMARFGLDFKMVGGEDDAPPPADVAALIASQLVRALQWAGSPDAYVLSTFETVVLYQHPFPSPQYPEQWHSSELYEEDGVVLFNLERAIPGITTPKQHFNIVLYEWCRAARKELNWNPTAELDVDLWPQAVRQMSGHDEHWVRDAVGLTEIDAHAVMQVLLIEFGTATISPVS